MLPSSFRWIPWIQCIGCCGAGKRTTGGFLGLPMDNNFHFIAVGSSILGLLFGLFRLRLRFCLWLRPCFVFPGFLHRFKTFILVKVEVGDRCSFRLWSWFLLGGFGRCIRIQCIRNHIGLALPGLSCTAIISILFNFFLFPSCCKTFGVGH
ncbi:hypothetical protein FB451DRAFT_1260218 [Mycena latifolia]|nr:hypothetical protein FB451DRAFT_1260218 [Mycena latifolia]